MSSTYLTDIDMRMIERLLAEVREPGACRDFDRETAAGRFLIDNFQRKRTTEVDLRGLLAARIKVLESLARGISRWDDEGGAPGKLPRTEAQRRIDNDTDGARRRAKETYSRNRLV
ncbi:hypothetical protein ACTDI4_05460 [Mesorhizobium sp. PUT5]|uniref:hypothetical protein n=1 Tax=Mesorhizobium sp. PUT5 TaxID=3454629 RepID=UPI003FA468D9